MPTELKPSSTADELAAGRLPGATVGGVAGQDIPAALTEAGEPLAGAVPEAGPGKISFLRRLLSNPRTLLAGIFLVLVGLAAVLAPVIAPHDYRDIVGKPLTSEGIFGIDDFGRDVFSRLLIGMRTSLVVAL